MPPTDFDGRLRQAFSLPTEPTASAEAERAIRAGLPRHRARRRLATGAVAVSILAVVGLVIGLTAVGPRPTPTVTAGPALRPAPGPACVEVQPGSGRPACVGTITSAPGAAAPSDRNALSYAQDHAAPTVAVRAGSRVVVSLPRGILWHTVTVVPSGYPAPAAAGAGRLALRVEAATGRTLAVVPHVAAGRAVITAVGSRSCATSSSCVPTTEQWSATLEGV